MVIQGGVQALTGGIALAIYLFRIYYLYYNCGFGNKWAL
jgi:hypothetical protein